MPTVILKTVVDSGVYVAWSTVVDSPTAVGTREEIRSFLQACGEDAADERFERADIYGTSATWPSDGEPFGGWHDDLFVGECLPAGVDGRILPRAHVEAFARAVDADDRDEMLALTRAVPAEGATAQTIKPCDDQPKEIS